MTFKILIIRAEGAFAETEDVRRTAFAKVFGEAGFAWESDRTAFATSASFGAGAARIAHYVRGKLRGRPESADQSLLISAMHRRASKMFSDLLVQRAATARPFVRDVILGAKAEGVRVMLAAAFAEADAKRLLRSLVGDRLVDFVEIVGVGSVDDSAGDDKKLYAAVRGHIDCEPREALVIEGAPAGAEAARELGFPVVVTRSSCVAPGAKFSQGVIVINSLADLVGAGDHPEFETLSKDGREELWAALHSLHASNCEKQPARGRSNNMRVADILKRKGADVRVIDPGATVRALASSLRASSVGAMPVVDKSGVLRGMISERDLARGLADYGADLSAMTVNDLMTRSVVTCSPDDPLIAVATAMTQRRVRHIPVVVDGKIVGMISIGDVLKYRLDEAKLEANVLRDAALTRR